MDEVLGTLIKWLLQGGSGLSTKWQPGWSYVIHKMAAKVSMATHKGPISHKARWPSPVFWSWNVLGPTKKPHIFPHIKSALKTASLWKIPDGHHPKIFPRQLCLRVIGVIFMFESVAGARRYFIDTWRGWTNSAMERLVFQNSSKPARSWQRGLTRPKNGAQVKAVGRKFSRDSALIGLLLSLPGNLFFSSFQGLYFYLSLFWNPHGSWVLSTTQSQSKPPFPNSFNPQLLLLFSDY